MLEFSLPGALSRSPSWLAAVGAADFPSFPLGNTLLPGCVLALPTPPPPQLLLLPRGYSCCPSPMMEGPWGPFHPLLPPNLHSVPMGSHSLRAIRKGTQDTHITVSDLKRCQQAPKPRSSTQPVTRCLFHVHCEALLWQQLQRSCFPIPDILAEGAGNTHGNK